MSDANAGKIAQLEAVVKELSARLEALQRQRNDAMDQVVVSQANAKLLSEALQKQRQASEASDATIKALGGELQAAKDALAAATTPVSPTPPPANGHDAAEACPQA